VCMLPDKKTATIVHENVTLLTVTKIFIDFVNFCTDITGHELEKRVTYLLIYLLVILTATF